MQLSIHTAFTDGYYAGEKHARHFLDGLLIGPRFFSSNIGQQAQKVYKIAMRIGDEISCLVAVCSAVFLPNMIESRSGIRFTYLPQNGAAITTDTVTRISAFVPIFFLVTSTSTANDMPLAIWAAIPPATLVCAIAQETLATVFGKHGANPITSTLCIITGISVGTRIATQLFKKRRIIAQKNEQLSKIPTIKKTVGIATGIFFAIAAIIDIGKTRAKSFFKTMNAIADAVVYEMP